MDSGQKWLIKVWTDLAQDSFPFASLSGFSSYKTYVHWMSYASLVSRISWIIMYKTYRFYWVEPSGSRWKCGCTVSPSHDKGSSVPQQLESVGWIHYFRISSRCAFGCRVRGMAGAQDQQTPTPTPPQQSQTVPSASVCFW